jgi:hypothetical protein
MTFWVSCAALIGCPYPDPQSGSEGDTTGAPHSSTTKPNGSLAGEDQYGEPEPNADLTTSELSYELESLRNGVFTEQLMIALTADGDALAAGARFFAGQGPWCALVLLGVAGWILQLGHAALHGPFASMLLAGAAIWLAHRERTEGRAPRPRDGA